MIWYAARKEVLGEIMKTDIVCEIMHTDSERASAVSCLDEVFRIFRDFEARYSRFIQGNELWQLNMSEESVVSEELFDLLVQAKRYHEMTGGIFDPSILPVMESSGYAGAYVDQAIFGKVDFSELKLDAASRTVTKPKDMLIDLGGIGKGFVIDAVTRFLAHRFDNFLVDAGGDIRVRGVNMKESYPYWAIDIEHPAAPGEAVATLLLKDRAVATSGRNRRYWVHEGEEKYHIIDPASRKNPSDELLSVTVIAQSATEADVFAKTLFIAGKEEGSKMAERLKMPAAFADKEGAIIRNHYIEPYVWKP